MSRIIQIEPWKNVFAMELDWTNILTARSPGKAIAAEAARRKSKFAVTHQKNQGLRGLSPDREVYGFYKGKSPGRGKVYSAASAFARLAAEKEALLVHPLGPKEALVEAFVMALRSLTE